MNQTNLVDIVLNELVGSRQPSISVRRILLKHKVDFNEQLIADIESVLLSKSLVVEKDKDSAGYACYALTETGRDFLKTFGNYSKFLKGIKSESRKVERARKKKPYDAAKTSSDESPMAYVPPEKSFIEKNGIGLMLLALFFILFYIVAKITS